MKKCLFTYGNYNINDLFDSHPSRINLHGQWIALKDQLYTLGIELVSKEFLNLKSPDLEIHLNVWKKENNKWPIFSILTETDYIHPDNSNIDLLKQYKHIFSWNSEEAPRNLSGSVNIQINSLDCDILATPDLCPESNKELSLESKAIALL